MSTLSTSNKRSSFLSRAKQSFLRSHGDRGANVETLRGLTGADFEGPARVTRGDSRTCGSFFVSFFGFKDKGEQAKARYLLLKGTNLFVFVKHNSPSPKYAIDLNHQRVSLHNHSNHQKHQMVYLEDAFGDVKYKFIFNVKENSSLAKDFVTSLKEKIAICDSNEIKEKLGHRPNYLPSQSVTYASMVAEKKIEDQPEAPLSAYDVMANEPTKQFELMRNMAY